MKMGPHHHPPPSSRSSSKWKSGCFSQRVLLLLLLELVASSSCGAITTAENVRRSKEGININVAANVHATAPIISSPNPTSISLNTSASVGIGLGVVGGLFADFAGLITGRNVDKGIKSRKVRNTGWLWDGQTSGDGEPSPKEPERKVAEAVKEEVESKIETHDALEARGYYTFVDYSTPPTAPSTSISNTCVCVPYYLCDEGQVATGTIDIRNGWGCNSVLEVCCRNPRPPVPTTTDATPHPIPTAQPGYNPQCGTLNPNGVNARILGFKDSEAQYGEYPWMAAVLESKQIRGKWVLQFLCGASLITPTVVLTAAHCVKGKRVSSLVIRLGEWDTQSTSEFYPYQDLKVAETLVHPQFYSGGLHNDVALVFLKSSAYLAPHVDTICLPRVIEQYDPNSCFATGWGKTAFGPSGQYQAILREVELAITPSDVCQGSLRQTNLGQKFNLHSSFICAGGQKGLDTCIGDGGGPLVCPTLADPWRYVLVGIVSWGVNCGTYGVPGVYVDVSKFRGWVDKEILLRDPYYNPSRWTIPQGPPQGG